MNSLTSIVSHGKFNNIDPSEIVRTKREKLNMTQKEFANALGLSINGDRTIRRWENGESKPSKLELKAILDFPENVPFPNPDNYDYTMIDLFAGIGGTRLGFQLHGNVKTVFSSEWDKFAQKTYYANFGEIPEGDITKIDEKDIPDHDILVAGFPCQPFSQAGLKHGFEDTRGTLFFNITRILKEKRPKMFLLENVRNLVSHDKGKTFEIIINTLKELEYSVFHKILNAKDFGVPQNRERIYIVGFSNKIYTNINFSFPEPINQPTRVKDILEPKVDEKYTISDTLWAGHQRRKDEHRKKGNGFGYRLFDENSEYTSTISARYYKDGSEILIDQGDNKNPRKITPREASRLQGFPDTFIIPVSDTQAYKQFGNTVAVPVVYKIAEQMMKADKEYFQNTPSQNNMIS